MVAPHTRRVSRNFFVPIFPHSEQVAPHTRRVSRNKKSELCKAMGITYQVAPHTRRVSRNISVEGLQSHDTVAPHTRRVSRNLPELLDYKTTSASRLTRGA